jgi:hypothetical protein
LAARFPENAGKIKPQTNFSCRLHEGEISLARERSGQWLNPEDVSRIAAAKYEAGISQKRWMVEAHDLPAPDR